MLFWSATEVMACSSPGKAQEVWGMGVSKAVFARIQLQQEFNEFGQFTESAHAVHLTF